jgi:hypothetical protein
MQFQTKAHNARGREQSLFEEMYKMQLQIYWGVGSNFEAKRHIDTGRNLKQESQSVVYINTSGTLKAMISIERAK